MCKRGLSDFGASVWPLAIVCLLATTWVGCGDDGELPESVGDKSEITPRLYWDMPPHQQAKVRTTRIYIPEGLGYADEEAQKGPWKSTFDRKVHQGETDYFVWQLARTMFEFENPTILTEGMAFDLWSPDLKAILGASLHSERSPALYIARSLPESMLDGYYADITDYLDEEWPEARDHPFTKAMGTFDGRVYCLPDSVTRWDVIAYRKDFFAEIGVTNEFGEPGPPSNWTWSDFRKYAKMLTKDTDGDGKIDRFGFVAEKGRFDLYYTHCNALFPRLYVPDKTGEFVWRFNADDPKLFEGIRKFRAMHWEDHSVLTGVSYEWLTKEREFQSDKVAMCTITSGHPPEWALTKPEMFPVKDKTTMDLLGMVAVPRADRVGSDAEGVLYRRASGNMFGFNPLYSPEQLRASIRWFKSFTCGYFNFLHLSTLRIKNETWGRPDPFPQYDLTRGYDSTVPMPEAAGREGFPKDWINVYDTYGALDLFPTPQEFGLLPPVQFGDALNSLFSELLFSRPKHRNADGSLNAEAEDALIAEMLATHTPRIEARCMNSKPRNAEESAESREKMKRYYTALAEFAEKSLPPDAARELIAFIESECRCW